MDTFEISNVIVDGTHFYNVYIDKSISKGVLNFTHEISVDFVLEDDELKFDSAWNCGVSEMEWSPDEEESFEETFPGLLDEMRKAIKEK